MSFEIKYDKDGQVISNPQTIQEAAPVVDNLATTEVEEESTVDNMETDDGLRTTEQRSDIDVNQEPAESGGRRERPSAEESYQAKNFRTLRDEKARSDRERDEALAKLRAYEMQQYNMQQQYKQPVEPEVEDVEIEIATDDVAEGKHIRALHSQVKKLQQIVKQNEQRSTAMTEEAKLLAKYPDYYNVVSTDTLAQLNVEDPELSHILDVSSKVDFYGAKAMAYKAIKKLSSVKQEPTYELEKAQIQKNAAKPKPLASLAPQQGDSPLSRANAFANGLTPALQEQLRREMADARRNN